jgi:hypothetical protein
VCELDDDEGSVGFCAACGACEYCCDCEELFDADELGLDPEDDDQRRYPGV